MPDRYRRFDVEILDAPSSSGRPSTYQVLARSHDGRRAEARVLPAQRLDDLRQRAARLPTSAGRDGKDLGCALYDEVFGGATGELWRHSDAEAERAKATQEIRICLPADSALHDLPWELLHDRVSYLALKRGVVLSRTVPRAGTPRLPPAPGRLRVLVTSGFAAQEAARLAREEVWIRRVLQAAPADVDAHAQVTSRRLAELFEAGPVHAWHHVGHGALARGGEDLEYRFGVQDPNPLRPATGEDFAEVLGQHRSLRLAVVSTCHGGGRVGLATCLARLEVPMVVGFVGLLSDPAAERFAEKFYESLITEPVGSAVSAARRALHSDTGLDALEWSQIVYYSSAENTRLVDGAVIAPKVQHDMPRGPRHGPGGGGTQTGDQHAKNIVNANHIKTLTFNTTRRGK